MKHRCYILLRSIFAASTKIIRIKLLYKVVGRGVGKGGREGGPAPGGTMGLCCRV